MTIEEHINLVFDMPAGNLAVFCDQSQLENALLNLVLNSRDAIMRHARGGRINAFTSRDYTVYFADVTSETLPLVIELEAERVANLDISDKTLASERVENLLATYQQPQMDPAILSALEEYVATKKASMPDAFM